MIEEETQDQMKIETGYIYRVSAQRHTPSEGEFSRKDIPRQWSWAVLRVKPDGHPEHLTGPHHYATTVDSAPNQLFSNSDDCFKEGAKLCKEWHERLGDELPVQEASDQGGHISR